jgi:multicomponent K+:H+ antiporter subunit E
MRERILPHPLLSFTLVVVWVLLANAITVGSVVLGMIVGVGVAKLTSVYWPGRPRLRSPILIAEYLAVFCYDVIVSNIQVAYLVLFRRAETLKSQFIEVPLDVTTPEAIVALAGTITLTPGTLSVDVAEDRRSLLVHCIDVADPDETVSVIKDRYERRLERILS